MTKEYWITNNRFKFIALLLLLIFLIFMGIVIWKADSLTHNACQICANKMSSEISCSFSNGGMIQGRTYYPNYSIFDWSNLGGG